jgi:hypothetical protein
MDAPKENRKLGEDYNGARLGSSRCGLAQLQTLAVPLLCEGPRRQARQGVHGGAPETVDHMLDHLRGAGFFDIPKNLAKVPFFGEKIMGFTHVMIPRKKFTRSTL